MKFYIPSHGEIVRTHKNPLLGWKMKPQPAYFFLLTNKAPYIRVHPIDTKSSLDL